jgi:osmotically inducible lipoprotein OsmB
MKLWPLSGRHTEIRTECANSARRKEADVRPIPKLIAAGLGLVLCLSACGEMPGQRAVTGEAIGACSGAAVGSAMGHPSAGAVVGGLDGAAVGAATTPEPRYNRYGYH